MPPHCDSLDGPVVTAARDALGTGEVDRVLPYVHADGEEEVRMAFSAAARAREAGGEARDVADRWFFETVVRVHRAGEGAPFTGLQPAGLDVGPVIPVAERALATGSPDELVDLLCSTVREQVVHRLQHAMRLGAHTDESVEAARAHVEATLGLQVWAHHLREQANAPAHEHG